MSQQLVQGFVSTPSHQLHTRNDSVCVLRSLVLRSCIEERHRSNLLSRRYRVVGYYLSKAMYPRRSRLLSWWASTHHPPPSLIQEREHCIHVSNDEAAMHVRVAPSPSLSPPPILCSLSLYEIRWQLARAAGEQPRVTSRSAEYFSGKMIDAHHVAQHMHPILLSISFSLS